MSLDALPDQIIGKILICLLDDPKAFVNLASTCTRFSYIANRVIIFSDEWKTKRTIVFDMFMEFDKYKPELCNTHGYCTEQQIRRCTNCELHMRPSHIENEDYDDPIDQNYVCFYHRLYCLMTAEYRCFSTLKFVDSKLCDRGCIKAFSDSLRQNKIVTEFRLKALVDLYLDRCDISLDWLNTILNELTNVTYLTLDGVSFVDPCILVEPRHHASRNLKLLKICGDRSCKMSDSIFTYFLDNFPAVDLDLTGTRVEFHKRIVERYYGDSLNHFDLSVLRPSEYIFSFPMVQLYLKKYQAIVQRFIADETNITLASLRRVLQDEDMKQLRVSIKNCPMISQPERDRLTQYVDESDLCRIIF